MKGILLKPILETPLGRLYEADCVKVLASSESESSELVFADPPFNLGKIYSSGIDDSIAEESYLTWCREWIDECIRILQPGGSFFLYNLPKWNLLLGHYIANSLTFRHWITVDIKFSLPIGGRLYPSHLFSSLFRQRQKAKNFSSRPPSYALLPTLRSGTTRLRWLQA
jgi:site-specific DNA-methyltransferase (adenine-specific)